MILREREKERKKERVSDTKWGGKRVREKWRGRWHRQDHCGVGESKGKKGENWIEKRGKEQTRQKL